MKEVKEVKKNFYSRTDKIYSAVLAAVVGDNGMIADALRELKK